MGITVSKARERVVIENVSPEVDRGRFPIKGTVGEQVFVEADIFADGHDVLACVLIFRREGCPDWSETPLEYLMNDRWRGTFTLTEIGRWQYAIQAWVDRFETWRRFLKKKVDSGHDVSVDLLVGAKLLKASARRAKGREAQWLRQWAGVLDGPGDVSEKVKVALTDDVAETMLRSSDRKYAAQSAAFMVDADRRKAMFSTWYEMFPRSCIMNHGERKSFQDCEKMLQYVADMGFDVLYLPPIHPIGLIGRKGKNNVSTAGPDDPGSPWAIGSTDGGHKAVHPQLGTLDSFRHLVARAKEYGLEVALDLAYNCSPDHPYVREHPEWFTWLPDGTIQFAENPPKKYEDIYPLNFETDHWQELWEELKSIVIFWIEQGVRIFRVDNPHTKPFAFWEWLIREVKAAHPDVLFLSEAFTRPKVMYRLAKLGFSQSYTYFTWRNSKWEIAEYFTELAGPEVSQFFRPNLWTNTPDILANSLQSGRRPAFMARLVLAATLGSNYGIYGPAFELLEHMPRESESEEYLDSEKYQIRNWDIERPDSLRHFIARVNGIRHGHPSLQNNLNLHFHDIENDRLICYSKHTDDRSDTILVTVNLDCDRTQTGWVNLNLDALGIHPHQTFQIEDLLNGSRYSWQGSHNYVELNPHVCPAHIFLVHY